MYLLLLLVPVICLTVIVISMVGFFWALFWENNIKLAIWLFCMALLMPVPMVTSAQAVASHTEQNLVVTESGQVAEVITNVHSVDFEDDVVTYTYRDGRVGHTVTSIDRRVNVQNSHPYHMN